MIALIFAMTENNVIGFNNMLPWHYSEELSYFKKVTTNQDILFGRITFENIRQHLKKRNIFVLTRANLLQCKYNNATIINDYQIIINKYLNNSTNLIFICGGAEIYSLFLPFADILYCTIIKKNFYGDTYFPKIKWSNFNLIKSTEYTDFITKIYNRKI